MITKEELKQLLKDVDSSNIERTISKDDPDKFCQAIWAFSNDLSENGRNGYLIIGDHDNGELSGLKVSDKTSSETIGKNGFIKREGSDRSGSWIILKEK